MHHLSTPKPTGYLGTDCVADKPDNRHVIEAGQFNLCFSFLNIGTTFCIKLLKENIDKIQAQFTHTHTHTPLLPHSVCLSIRPSL